MALTLTRYSTAQSKVFQDLVWDLAFDSAIELIATGVDEAQIAAAAEGMLTALGTDTNVTQDDAEAIIVSNAKYFHGTGQRLIEVLPAILNGGTLTPIRVAVMLHEFGHHLHPDGMRDGLSNSEHELAAWLWALDKAAAWSIGWDMACHEMMLCGLEQRLFELSDRPPHAREMALYQECIATSCRMAGF